MQNVTLYTFKSEHASSLWFLYVSSGTYEDTFFIKKEFFEFAVTLFILMNLMFDSGVILWGEIWCLSLCGVEELNQTRLGW